MYICVQLFLFLSKGICDFNNALEKRSLPLKTHICLLQQVWYTSVKEKIKLRNRKISDIVRTISNGSIDQEFSLSLNMKKLV